MSNPVIPMILYHHENYEGTGYPEGLKGDNIPLWSRILRVVDSYDAMTSSRPYKRALSSQDALKKIMDYRGIHYDPEVFDIFISVIKQDLSYESDIRQAGRKDC